MKLRLMLFGLIATFMFAACSKDDDNPNNLPKSEAELKTNISKKWDIASNNTYKSIEFMDNATFKVAKQDGNSIDGTYAISEDLQTLTLTNFGVITLTNLTSDKLSFSVKPTGSDKEISLSCYPATLKILISEIQRKYNDIGFKPQISFTYDANGLLKEANEYSYKENGEIFANHKYTFTRDKDNKLTKVEYTSYYEGEKSNEKYEYTFAYKGDNISQVNEIYYYSNEESGEDVYNYTWQNGKVVKMEQDDDDTVVFEYKNGNYPGGKYSESEVYGDTRYDETGETVNTYDVNKKNWYSYMPIEFILVDDPDDLRDGYPFCDNNISNSNQKYENKHFDVQSNKMTWESSGQSVITYTYTYNSKGLVEEYKEVDISTYKWKSLISGEGGESSDTYEENYKLKYVEL